MDNQRLQHLIQEFEAGTLSDQHSVELEVLLQKNWAAIPMNQDVTHIDWEQMYRRIIQADLQSVKKDKKVFALRAKMQKWAVAAVIAALVFAIWLIDKQGEKKKQQQAVEIAYTMPGKDRAILKLGDGRIIQLDSTSKIISEANGVKISNVNGGQLLFNVADESGVADISYNELTTANGGQYQAVLPDGSKVWLNAASSIRFPSHFSGHERRVTISGEAYLEVAKNATKPFLVTVGTSEIEVLGTSFNVNSYADEPTIQTTLVEGSIRVKTSVNQPASSVILSAGQQAVQGKKLLVRQANLEQVLAWKNGYFNFNGLTLQEILRSIARWYDMEIIYDGVIRQEKFGGAIQRDLNLKEILNVLKQTGVHFKIDGKKLIVIP